MDTLKQGKYELGMHASMSARLDGALQEYMVPIEERFLKDEGAIDLARKLGTERQNDNCRPGAGFRTYQSNDYYAFSRREKVRMRGRFE